MFDPYHKWLGILPKDQPPNHYRLLSVEVFESDLDVIEGSADRLMGFVRQYQSGERAADALRILNELANARLCLLKPEAKAAYDAKLKQELTPAEPEFPEVPFELDLPNRNNSQRRRKKTSSSKSGVNLQSMVIGGGAVFALGLLAMFLFAGRAKPRAAIAPAPVEVAVVSAKPKEESTVTPAAITPAAITPAAVMPAAVTTNPAPSDLQSQSNSNLPQENVVGGDSKQSLPPLTPEELRSAVTEFANAGGTVGIRNRGTNAFSFINRGDPFPERPFEITMISSGRIEHVALQQLGPKLFREPILGSLESLNFHYPTIETSDLKLAAGCRNLLMLNVAGSSIDDEGTKLFSNWPRLQQFNFIGTKITEKGVAEIGKLVNLRSLICNSKVNDEALIHLGNLQGLDFLVLDGKFTQPGALQSTMGNIHGPGLKHLAPLKNLRQIVLKSQPLSDDSMKNFPSLPNLSMFEFGDTQIGDATMELLADNRGLTVLNVEGTKVTGQSLKLIATMPKLQRLVWNNSATDDDLSYLQKMSFNFLSFNDCKITGTGFRFFEDCQQLKSLYLTNNPITDDGLAKLPTHLKLTTLMLSRTKITDASIPHLQKFGTLGFLSLDGTKMTAAGVARLKQALPKCTVQGP